MDSSSRGAAFTATMVLALSATLFARPPVQNVQSKGDTGSISGSVTNDERPARGITVLLVPAEPSSTLRVVAKGITDDEGHFHIKGVVAGSYFLQAFAPGLVSASENVFAREGKAINLLEGEAAEGIEITLKPGGVITGQITDSDGQPLIQESVRLFLADSASQQGRKQPVYLPYNFMFSTDDRGVYRLFGLPPGRYIVGAGVDTGPNARIGLGNTYHPLTYHPDVREEAKARIVEVASGGEASGVDIVVGQKARSYSVTGRIVDAVSGKAIVGMAYGHGARDSQSGRLNIATFTSSTTNARGEFRLEGVTPGEYGAFANPSPDSDMYSEIGPFSVGDSDVNGVVVKVHVGSRIAGHVTIEGAGQPGAPRLSEVRLGVSSGSLNVAHRMGQVRVDPDGNFRTNGLPRGIANFSLAYPAPKGLALMRVERDGVEQKNGIEVGSGEEITGVKLIFAYGTGSIRGQVKVEGGDIGQATRMFINITRIETNQPLQLRMPAVDSRGRFFLEGIQPGEYELSLYVQLKSATPSPGSPAIISKNLKQIVTVANGSESQVTIIVDLSASSR